MIQFSAFLFPSACVLFGTCLNGLPGDDVAHWVFACVFVEFVSCVIPRQ